MIGIVVLNYNNWDDTVRCLNSIFNNEKKAEYHIYVVDNASPQRITQEAKHLFRKDKRITFIQKEENSGYSAGNNSGIKQALLDGCEEILIANNDVLFMENSIYNLYQYLNTHTDIGIVGPKVYLPNGQLQMINMGVRTGLKEKYMYLLRKTIFAPFVKSFINQFCALEQDLTKPFEVHSVSGCCFMMSKSCARDITPLDEATFLYQEELIIGIRMEQSGYKTIYYPESEIIHAHGQSTKNIKAFSYICLVESEIYYFKKYLNTSTIAILPLYLFRTSKYLIFSFIYSDFRENAKKYFSRTIKKLIQK